MVSSRDDLYRCSLCKRVMLKKSVRLHLLTAHRLTKEEIMDVKCDSAQEMSLGDEQRKSWPVFCPVCEEKVPDHSVLAMHCAKLHQDVGACGQPQDYKVFTKTFRTDIEFEKWLSDESERHCTSLSRRTSSADGCEISLRCHRSGKYVNKSLNGSRVAQSKKQVQHCSCFLNVRMDDSGVVTVTGCWGHIGHKLEASLLRFSSLQELFLKSLLEKHSMDYILDGLKREYSSKTSSRLAFVDRRDLWNIAKRYKIVPIPAEHDYTREATPMDDDQSCCSIDVVGGCDDELPHEDHSEEHSQIDTANSLNLTKCEIVESSSSHADDSSRHGNQEEIVECSEDVIMECSEDASTETVSPTASSQDLSSSFHDVNHIAAPPVPKYLSRTVSPPSTSQMVVQSTPRLEAPVPPRPRLEAPSSISLYDSKQKYSPSPLQRTLRKLQSLRKLQPLGTGSEQNSGAKTSLSTPSTSKEVVKFPVKQIPKSGAMKCYAVTEEMLNEMLKKQGHNEVVLDGHRPTELVDVPVPMVSTSESKKKLKGGDEIWRCKLCTRVLLRKSLYMHLRNIHGFPKEEVEDIKRQIAEEASTRATNPCWVVCPICNEKFINHTGLALHCNKAHKDDGAGGLAQDYRVFTVNFDTVVEFERWLDEECERKHTTLSRRNSATKGGLITLRCNRAGKHKAQATKRCGRTRKATESCSCFMNVHIRSDGSVSAYGCFGHAGHDIDVSLLRLSTSQELFLKSLLEEVSMDAIIAHVKEVYPPQTSKLHHITRSDLWNIAHKYNIPVPGKKK